MPERLNEVITPEKLDEIDKQIVLGLVSGKSGVEIAKELNRKPRWVQLRINLPHIQAILAEANQQTVSYISQATSTTIPGVGQRISNLVEPALTTLEGIIKGTEKASQARVKAIEMVLKMAMVTNTQTLHGEERRIKPMGISDKSAEDIRRKILGIQTMNQLEEAQAEEFERQRQELKDLDEVLAVEAQPVD